jgi:hypothetical protein
MTNDQKDPIPSAKDEVVVPGPGKSESVKPDLTPHPSPLGFDRLTACPVEGRGEGASRSHPVQVNPGESDRIQANRTEDGADGPRTTTRTKDQPGQAEGEVKIQSDPSESDRIQPNRTKSEVRNPKSEL